MTEEAIDKTAFEIFGVTNVKQHQRDIIKYLIEGEDVFAILPTGFGKSLPYQIFPRLWTDQVLILIVSPLVALMKDQVRKLNERGLKAAIITDVSIHPANDITYLYGSPENFLQKPDTLESLKRLFSKQVKLIVVDEVHTIPKWGESMENKRKWKPGKKIVAFRKFFSQVGEIRSFFPKVPVLALTATATLQTKTQVIESLGLTDCKMIEETPDRTNIRYSVIRVSTSIPGTFYWLVDMLRGLKLDFPRTVVYCHSIDQATNLYNFMSRECPNLTHLLGMHHSETDEYVQNIQLSEMSTEGSGLRLVFCTSALGMGVDMKEVHNIIHYGPPLDIEGYVQETGRGGRDGDLTQAVLLFNGRHIKDNPEFKQYVLDTGNCRRKHLMNYFVKQFNSHIIPRHNCCDICSQTCKCAKCDYSYVEKCLKVVDTTSDSDSSVTASSIKSDAEFESDIESSESADSHPST